MLENLFRVGIRGIRVILIKVSVLIEGIRVIRSYRNASRALTVSASDLASNAQPQFTGTA